MTLIYSCVPSLEEQGECTAWGGAEGAGNMLVTLTATHSEQADDSPVTLAISK